MFLDALDLLIGLVVVYFMLSLVLVAFREAIEARLKSRARHLALGIMQILNSKNDAQAFYNSPLIASLYRPSVGQVRDMGGDEVYSRFDDNIPLPPGDYKSIGFWAPIKLLFAIVARPTESELPSYIPSRAFAQGIVALALSRAAAATSMRAVAGGATTASARAQADAALGTGSPSVARAPVAAFSAAGVAAVDGAASPHSFGVVSASEFSRALEVLSLQNCTWAQALRVIVATAGDDLELALKGIENWYDGTMDRVSGWYKRESHFIAFWIGLILAAALNVDSIFLAKHLANSDAARDRLVQIADLRLTAIQQATAASAPSPIAGQSPSKTDEQVIQAIKAADKMVVSALKDYSELGLPIGWSQAKWATMWTGPFDAVISSVLQTFLGWLITALALTLGAPFWFDVLNKIMVVRSTVKPKEKSGEEGSEDRRK